MTSIDQSNKQPNFQHGDDFFAKYIDSIIQAMNLDMLEQDDRKKLEEKIVGLINKRIINAFLLYLPTSKVADFQKNVNQENAEETINFFMTNIPDSEKKILAELDEIKNELAEIKTDE